MPGGFVNLNRKGPSQRVQVVPFPQALPGKCALCGAADHDNRNYVDFGLQVDFYGSVLLCGFCIKDIAEALGYLSPDDAEHNIEIMNDHIRENIRLTSENEGLKNALRVLLDNFDLDTDEFLTRLNSLPTEQVVEEPSSGEGEADNSAEQSNPESGPDAIPSATGGKQSTILGI